MSSIEEKKIEERFEQEFPGKILINKRSYYDNYYANKCTYIREVNFERENDSYYKGLEYFYKKHRPSWEYGILRMLLSIKAILLWFIGMISGNTYLRVTYKKALQTI